MLAGVPTILPATGSVTEMVDCSDSISWLTRVVNVNACTHVAGSAKYCSGIAYTEGSPQWQPSGDRQTRAPRKESVFLEQQAEMYQGYWEGGSWLAKNSFSLATKIYKTLEDFKESDSIMIE